MSTPGRDKPRTVDIVKDDSRFGHFRYIASSFADMIAPQVHDLREGSLEGWARKAAALHGDLNAVHPFREGNGRACRLFMRALANERGLDVAFERVTRAENVGAFMLAHAGHNGQLEALYDRIVHPLRMPQRTADRERAANADVSLEMQPRHPSQKRR